MLKKAIDKLNGQRSLDDILAPVELKVQELHNFVDVSRNRAIELRVQAEALQREAAALESDASTALSIAVKMQEFCV